MTFRPGSAADAALLSSLHQACFPNYWNPDAFTDFFKVLGTSALVAEADTPVGMMVWRALPGEAEIITLVVLPAWRRQGLARRMLEVAMNHARKLGAEHMFLDVEDGNQAALNLYRSQGFSHVRRRKHYYRKQDGTFTDALVMRVKLA